MKFGNLLKPKRRADDESLAGYDDLSINTAADKKQRLLLGVGGGAAVIIAALYIFSGNDDADGSKLAADVQMNAKDLVNGPGSEQEWMAESEARLRGIENQLLSREVAEKRVTSLEQELVNARKAKGNLAADGSRVMGAYQEENDRLRAALAAAQKAAAARPPIRPPGPPLPPAASGVQAESNSLAFRGANNEVKLVSFADGSPSAGPRITDNKTSYSDSPDYLPPNSIASAKVIVGVNASAGVNSQSDPLPVVLRVTGPARSVYSSGKLLTTNIQGCLINGAARGDLSSERIYVKIQKMTCPQDNGRFAVSNVKGFIAFGGTTGVRGRVVSREGSLATQAFLAGLIGGFGEGLSSTANPLLSGNTIISENNSKGAKASDILRSGFGSAARQTGETVSKYLIERAEQYQPVVEMPVGIDVEVVFLEGVFIQS